MAEMFIEKCPDIGVIFLLYYTLTQNLFDIIAHNRDF